MNIIRLQMKVNYYQYNQCLEKAGNGDDDKDHKNDANRDDKHRKDESPSKQTKNNKKEATNSPKYQYYH